MWLLESEPVAFSLRFGAKVTAQSAIEKGGALRNSRHFIVEDDGGGSFNPFDRFHRISAEVRRAFSAPIPFSPAGRAIDTKPVGGALGVTGTRG
jgi:hypothetical protein